MADSSVAIRFATSADLEFVGQGRVTDKIMRRKIEWQEVIVAEQHGKAIGCVWLEYLWSVLPYLSLLWVEPEYRRQGTGKALLHHTETFLRGKGHHILYSSSQANEPEPQAWHRHMGFEECGIIAGMNDGGIGEVFFRKRL